LFDAGVELIALGVAAIAVSGTSFGQTQNCFRDFSNTNDPGSRTLDFYVTQTF
jgi:hypothetical protein